MMNQIISDVVANKEVIEVGTPACFLSYSDRSPGTVSEIINKRTIRIESCKYKVTGGPYEYGDYMTYDYFPRTVEEMKNEPRGRVYTLRKNGKWIPKGVGLWDSNGCVIGYRENYRDPSF